MSDELLAGIKKAQEAMLEVGVTSAEVLIAQNHFIQEVDEETRQRALDGETLYAFEMPIVIVEDKEMPSSAFAVVRALDE